MDGVGVELGGSRDPLEAQRLCKGGVSSHREEVVGGKGSTPLSSATL